MIVKGIHRWSIAASAFLQRAREQLALFECADDVQALLVAALMLRFGIEARLFEYIRAELPPETREADLVRISEFAATKLLLRLTDLNPRTEHGSTIVFHPQAGGKSFGFRYTPVTKSLATLHGKLGGLLHMNYFIKHPHWYVARETQTSGPSTLSRARDLIARGIEELAGATAGTLLNNPAFQDVVYDIADEISESESERDDINEQGI